MHPTYLDTFTFYHYCPKILNTSISFLKFVERVANSVDPDQTPRSAASDLGLHCLLRSVCPNF